VYSPQPGCQQWHAKGAYQIPYRCLYSRNISNLFLAGRIISATHIAFGSTRVMATCAHSAQAVGIAAALCLEHGVEPRALGTGERLRELQTALLRQGQFIPGVKREDRDDLAQNARITASSTLALAALPAGPDRLTLDAAWAMLLPLAAGTCPTFTFFADVSAPTMVEFELRTAARQGNFTPDLTLASRTVTVAPGAGREIAVTFPVSLDQARYVFVCLRPNPALRLHLSDQRLTGVLSLSQSFNKAVGKSAVQEPPEGSGFDRFEFWLPQRRPDGKNLALRIDPPLAAFAPANVVNGIDRPAASANAWLAANDDHAPELTLRWPEPVTLAKVVLGFDSDFDHPLESVLMGHPERTSPFCVTAVTLHDGDGALLGTITENYLSSREVVFPESVVTRELRLRLSSPASGAPAGLFAVRAYSPA
jgi:hypothetical protein